MPLLPHITSQIEQTQREVGAADRLFSFILAQKERVD
jgi:hypothetical protein